MSIWRPWPYAATAIVQHEWDTNLLNVWVIFKYPMDQTVKPAHGLWLCEVDDILKAITVSAWQDEWTILLTVPNVLALPGRVTLEYDGPSESLRTTWDKQWEPWGPILSRRIPYLWEDILVVDTVNKRVGIQPGVTAAAVFAWALTIVSPDGNEQIGIHHDNDDAYFQTTNGGYRFLQANDVDGIRVYGFDDVSGMYAHFYVNSLGTGVLHGSTQFKFTSGTGIIAIDAATDVHLNRFANGDVVFFGNAAEGETQKQKTYGRRTGDSLRHVDLQISPDANNTALWSGVGDYVFDGNLRATGRLVSGTLTHSAVGPTDNLDVSGVNTVFIDCSGSDVTIGGFVGGVNGQVLNLVRLCAAANDATLEHNEAHAFQKIFLHKGLDETLTGEYGGWTLVCNGTSWFDASHAKHV